MKAEAGYNGIRPFALARGLCVYIGFLCFIAIKLGLGALCIVSVCLGETEMYQAEYKPLGVIISKNRHYV